MCGLRSKSVAIEKAPGPAGVSIPPAIMRRVWLYRSGCASRRQTDRSSDRTRLFDATERRRVAATWFLARPKSLAELERDFALALQAGYECGEIALVLSGGNPAAGAAAATVCGAAQLRGWPIQQWIQAAARAVEQFVTLRG